VKRSDWVSDEILRKFVKPFQAVASERLRKEGLELGPEAGVEPAVHDRVGERGGERQRLAQAQHKEVSFVILKNMENKMDKAMRKL